MNTFRYTVARRAAGALVRGLALAAFIASLCAGPWLSQARAQAPIIYPSHGQSIEQQAADEAECRAWAQQQTNFNPAQAPQYQSTTDQGRGSVVRGAAGGAALGAVGGAIGGSAGKGAAIGAGVGAAGGLLGRRRHERQADQANQQAQQAYNANLTEYNRAFATCMGGRGYTVG